MNEVDSDTFQSFNIFASQMCRDRKLTDDWEILITYRNDAFKIFLVSKTDNKLKAKWEEIMSRMFIEKQPKRAAEILLEQVEKQIKNVHSNQIVQV